MNEDYYTDWLTDNGEYLRDKFAEQNEDKFYEFCRKSFREREDK